MLSAFEELKKKEKSAQESINRLTELNEDLSRKLSIKKKKENKSIRDKITSSFSGTSKHNPVYSSFAFLGRDSLVEETTPKQLDLPEIEDLGDMMENVSFDSLNDTTDTPIGEQPISALMNKKKVKSAEVVEVGNGSGGSAEQQKTIVRLESEKKELQVKVNGLYDQLQKINEELDKVTTELQTERGNIAELRQKLKKTKKEAELTVEIQTLNIHV